MDTVEFKGYTNNFLSTVDSTSATTGTIIVNGGIGIAKSLYVGNNVQVMERLDAKRIRVSEDPTDDSDVCTKRYIDNRIRQLLSEMEKGRN